MKCTHCGTEIADDCTFCPECGTGVTTLTQDEVAKEKEAETVVDTQEPVAEPSVAQTTSEAQTPAQTQAPAQTYIPVAQKEITEDTLPAKFKPMGAWSYFGHSILFSIPVVGLILLIIFATGGTRNINKRNYARSYFCGLAIFAVIVIAIIALALIFGITSGASASIDSIVNSAF